MQPFFRDVVMPSHKQDYEAHRRFVEQNASAKPKRRPLLRVFFSKRVTS